MAKSKVSKNKNDSIKTDIFSSDWIYLLILFAFWLFLFRNLLSGSAWLHDDFPYVYYPGKFFAAVSLSNGIIPFWNPFSFGGTPFLADPQVSIFYPFTYILKFFVSNNSISSTVIQAKLVLHYLILAVSCFYLAKELKFSRFSSFIFALMYTYCSYMIIHAIHMNLIETVVWLPLLLLLVIRYINTSKLIYILGAGVLMGMCVLAGYPQCFVFNYIFIGIVFLYYIVSNFRANNKPHAYRLAAALIGFVAISAGIAVFQLLPTYVFSENSERQAITYDFASQGSIHPYDLITFFMPKFFGVFNWNEGAGEMAYWSLKSAGGHQEGKWMFTISTFYLTLLPLFLLIPAVRYYWANRNKTLPIVGISVIGLVILLFSFGKYFFLHSLVFNFVPILNKFRNSGHVSYLFLFCLAIIALYGLERLINDKQKFRSYFSNKYLIYCGSIFLFIFLSIKLGFISSMFPLTANPQVSEWVSSQANVFFFLSAAYLIVLFLYANDKLQLSGFRVLLILIVLLDIYLFSSTLMETKTSPEMLYSRNIQGVNQLKAESDKEQFRINMREGGSMLFERSQGLVSRIQLLEGVNVLTLDRKFPFSKPGSNDQTLDLLNVKYKISVDSLTKRQGLILNEGYIPRAKMFYDVKVISDTAAMRQYMGSPEYDYTKTIVIEKNPENVDLSKVTYDSVKAAGSKVNITKIDVNEIDVEVESAADGFLMMSEIFYPEWEVYVDGEKKEIMRADYCLRSVYVPQGKHNVKFVYHSSGFSNGWKVSLSILMLTIAGMVFLYYKDKRNADKGSSV